MAALGSRCLSVLERQRKSASAWGANGASGALDLLYGWNVSISVRWREEISPIIFWPVLLLNSPGLRAIGNWVRSNGVAVLSRASCHARWSRELRRLWTTS